MRETSFETPIAFRVLALWRTTSIRLQVRELPELQAIASVLCVPPV